jgi:hypothetical protein
MSSDRVSCCVPGCRHSASHITFPQCIEAMCEDHYALASPAARARRARSEERLRSLQERWDDEAYFDRLVACGKYLKLCGTLSLAAENAERAWRAIKSEVCIAAQSRGSAEEVRIADAA